MAVPIIKALPKVSGKMPKGAGGFLGGARLLLTFFVVFIIILNTVLIYTETKDPSKSLEYIGGKIALTTANLNDQAQEILDEGSIATEGEGFFSKAWSVIKNIWGLIEPLIIMFYWIKILSWIALHMIIFDSSKESVANMIGLGIFFSLNIMFNLAFTEFSNYEAVAFPFLAFWKLLKVIPIIFTPFRYVGDWFT